MLALMLPVMIFRVMARSRMVNPSVVWKSTKRGYESVKMILLVV